MSKARMPRMRTGSVLMEFVIVAPLYFILLGGLFAVADLSSARIRMHVADHFVTWVGSSRFCPLNADGDPDGDLVEAVLQKMYDRSIGGALASDQFRVTWEDNVDINRFMNFYKGGVLKLEVNMPSWARGMIQMQDVMTGSGTEGSALKGKASFSCDFERSYCFNRQELDADPAYNRSRSVSAESLATQGYVKNVFLDDWIGRDGDSEDSSLTTAPEGFPNGRVLGKFAE